MHDTTTNKGVITFKYPNSSLFDDVSLLSSYMVKNIKMDEASALDEFSISEDEKEIFNECLKQALPNLYDVALQMMPNCEGAFSEGLSDGNISISIKDNGSYNVNVLSLVDATLYDCLKYGILSAFYSICVNDALFTIANSKMVANINQLKQRMFQLKKKTVSPQF